MSTINMSVPLSFKICISYSVRIISDYVNFHNSENVTMAS